MSYTIRPISEADNAAIAKVIRDCLIEYGHTHGQCTWADPFLDRLSTMYTDENTQYWVAVDDRGEIVAGCGINPLPDEPGVCVLHKMYSVPKVRGTGVARQIMDTVLNFSAKHYDYCYLETFTNMVEAQKLYSHYGFEPLEGPRGNTGHTACEAWFIRDLSDLKEEQAEDADLGRLADVPGDLPVMS